MTYCILYICNLASGSMGNVWVINKIMVEVLVNDGTPVNDRFPSNAFKTNLIQSIP